MVHHDTIKSYCHHFSYVCVIYLVSVISLCAWQTRAWTIFPNVVGFSRHSHSVATTLPLPQGPRWLRLRRHALSFSENDDDGQQEEQEEGEEEEGEEEDWRDVRAKLIQQFRSSSSLTPTPRTSTLDDEATNSSSNATATTATSSSIAATTCNSDSTATTEKTKNNKKNSKWAYDSGDVVEQGSLIVSHPVQDFACGGLRQQYFHKCVVLVVKHDAHFTKGVILNRPIPTYAPQQELSSSSSSSSSSQQQQPSQKLKDDHGNEWTVWFAGDVQGLHSPHLDYTCLHRLKSPLALELSLPVVKDIQVSFIIMSTRMVDHHKHKISTGSRIIISVKNDLSHNDCLYHYCFALSFLLFSFSIRLGNWPNCWSNPEKQRRKIFGSDVDTRVGGQNSCRKNWNEGIGSWWRRIPNPSRNCYLIAVVVRTIPAVIRT